MRPSLWYHRQTTVKHSNRCNFMCFSSSCHSCEISPSFKADWQNLKTPASHYCVKLQLDIKLYFCWFCQCLDHEMMMWLASCLIHSLWDVGCDAACCLPSEKVYIIFFHCGQRSLNHEPIMCNYFHTAVEYLQNVHMYTSFISLVLILPY